MPPTDQKSLIDSNDAARPFEPATEPAREQNSSRSRDDDRRRGRTQASILLDMRSIFVHSLALRGAQFPARLRQRPGPRWPSTLWPHKGKLRRIITSLAALSTAFFFWRALDQTGIPNFSSRHGFFTKTTPAFACARRKTSQAGPHPGALSEANDPPGRGESFGVPREDARASSRKLRISNLPFEVLGRESSNSMDSGILCVSRPCRQTAIRLLSSIPEALSTWTKA